MKYTPKAISGARRPKAGFTIVEVVITFIIIGILALIMTPMLVNRSKQAKVTATTKDLEIIADAMERVAIDTGYYVRPYVLDDGLGGNGVGNTEYGDTYEGVRDNEDEDIYYTDPEYFFISITTDDFATNQSNLWNRLSENETNFNYNGPYLIMHRDENDNDWPDDPWGNDYLLFTRAGGLKPAYAPLDEGVTDYSSEFYTTLSYEVSSSDVEFDTDVFKLPTLLSLGPNGLPGDGTATTNFGDGDDIIRSFGGGSTYYDD